MLHDLAELARLEQGLGVVSTLRADKSIQSSVVNLGVLSHSISGADVVVFVCTARSSSPASGCDPGWPGPALRMALGNVGGHNRDLGPDDPYPGGDANNRCLLLREVDATAGGAHESWDEYDRVLATERRAAVLVRPERIYGACAWPAEGLEAQPMPSASACLPLAGWGTALACVVSSRGEQE